MSLRSVLITVSNVLTGDFYLAKSYPDSDRDNDGNRELYETPVYKVYIEGTNENGVPVKEIWSALRFMPYWNDPQSPDTSYRARGWINAGKHYVRKKAVTYYNPAYGTRNSYSPYSGAIQIDGNFLIHAGPRSLKEVGWGSAGCVEIIGDFNLFKKQIHRFSGSESVGEDEGILELVRARELFVRVDKSTPPDFQKRLVRNVSRF